MKLQKILLVFGIVSVLFVVTGIYFHKSEFFTPRKIHYVQSESSEGTKEDPFIILPDYSDN